MSLKTLILFSFICAGFCGCGFTDYKNGASASGQNPTSVVTAPPPNLTGGSSPVTFSDVSTQIFQPKCVGCHGAGGAPDLTTYSTATNSNYVTAGNALSSPLYSAVATGAMPKDGAKLSQTEIALIYNWIQDGAQP